MCPAVLVCHVLLIAFLLDGLRLSSALNCTHGKDDVVTSKSVQGNFCVYYEVYTSDTCESVQNSYADGITTEPALLDQKCGAFTDSLSNTIVACFCTTDNCNTLDLISVMLEHYEPAHETLPGVFTWIASSDRNLTKTFMKCLKQNVANMLGSRPPRSDMVLIIIIGSCVGIVLCCGLVPVLYILKEKRRKKRLADTWEQRVKQAGEELSSSASGLGTSSSKKKEEKSQTK